MTTSLYRQCFGQAEEIECLGIMRVKENNAQKLCTLKGEEDTIPSLLWSLRSQAQSLQKTVYIAFVSFLMLYLKFKNN